MYTSLQINKTQNLTLCNSYSSKSLLLSHNSIHINALHRQAFDKRLLQQQLHIQLITPQSIQHSSPSLTQLPHCKISDFISSPNIQNSTIHTCQPLILLQSILISLRPTVKPSQSQGHNQDTSQLPLSKPFPATHIKNQIKLSRK